MNMYSLMGRMQLKLPKVVGSTIYNLGVTSKTRVFLGAQTSLSCLSGEPASEESQVNYDVLPFSSEDEIDSSLFNVNLYITAIKKKRQEYL